MERSMRKSVSVIVTEKAADIGNGLRRDNNPLLALLFNCVRQRGAEFLGDLVT